MRRGGDPRQGGAGVDEHRLAGLGDRAGHDHQLDPEQAREDRRDPGQALADAREHGTGERVAVPGGGEDVDGAERGRGHGAEHGRGLPRRERLEGPAPGERGDTVGPAVIAHHHVEEAHLAGPALGAAQQVGVDHEAGAEALPHQQGGEVGAVGARALGERGEVGVVLHHHGTLERLDEAGVHGGPVDRPAARRMPVGVDRGGDADDGQQAASARGAGLLEHPVEEAADGLHPHLGRGGAHLDVGALERPSEGAAGGGELPAAQVGGAGGEGVLPGVDGEQDGGVLAQRVVPRGAAALDGAGGPGRGDLVEQAGLLELRAHSEHGGAGQAGRGHRVRRGEGVHAQGVLHERLPVGAPHQLRRARPSIMRC